jgi:hypothetical protein
VKKLLYLLTGFALAALIFSPALNGQSSLTTVNLASSLSTGNIYTSTTGTTMNLAGEETFLIGQLYFPAQTGSKTCSAAGSCVIYFNTASSVTWANVGTNLRVGIQDVATTGLEDGTFDVHADLVPGTETLANQLLHSATMESGTKSIAYGAIIAVGMDMTARAGADQVTIDRVLFPDNQATYGFPYGSHLAVASTNLPLFTIKFDDGTYGWINQAPLTENTNIAAVPAINFNSGSTPDEYVGGWTYPAGIRLCSIGVYATSIAAADTFEVVLYSSPFSSPAVVETVTPDTDQLVASSVLNYMLATPYDVTANAEVGIALRPTSANDITWNYRDLTSGFNVLKNAQPFTTIKMGSRTNQTGAFAETQTYHLPDIRIGICGFASGSGGASAAPFVGLNVFLRALPEYVRDIQWLRVGN